MRFVQFYFGLPLAMVDPLRHAPCRSSTAANVYTAYEYLENRFDAKTRALVSGIFLMQRGLAARHHDLRAGDHPDRDPRLADWLTTW